MKWFQHTQQAANCRARIEEISGARSIEDLLTYLDISRKCGEQMIAHINDLRCQLAARDQVIATAAATMQRQHAIIDHASDAITELQRRIVGLEADLIIRH